MTPRIETLNQKKLVGRRLSMSLSNNRTAELWHSFMPQRNNIQNRVSSELISLQVYPSAYFADFSPTNEFQKWALTEVSDFQELPEGMESFILPGGLYAVFHYTGLSSDPGIFQYIFGIWLPDSGYFLDDRPHFEVLDERYRNNDPNSEEEIWIPIRKS